MTTSQPATGKRGRLFWVPAPQYFNLNQCCRVIHEAYPDNYGIYLVGSALVRRDYRDVDVRMILGDEDFAARFGSANRPDMNAAWSLTCSSIACWLSLQTGLPVDFQIQQMTSANEEFPRKDGFERHHLGLFTRPNPPDYSKDAPQLMQPAASQLTGICDSCGASDVPLTVVNQRGIAGWAVCSEGCKAESKADERGGACDHKVNWIYAASGNVYVCSGCGDEMPITTEEARKLPYDPSAGR